MRRLGLLMLVSAIAITPMRAQQVKPSRFAASGPALAAALAPALTDTVPRTGRQPLPPGFVSQQAFAGFAGFTIGALAGGFIAGRVAPTDNGGFGDLANAIFGMAIGGALGSSITVYRFSNGKGFRSSYPATLVGSVAGFFGGPLFWLTVPIGSTVGYNLARK